MSSENRALTLLEVVAALALLTTMLVMILAAHDRLAHQTRRAELRLVAIDAADQLLATWTTTSPMVIPAAQGELATRPPLYWQVTAIASPELLPYGVGVAELRVFDEQAASAHQGAPLASVEFLTTAALPRP